MGRECSHAMSYAMLEMLLTALWVLTPLTLLLLWALPRLGVHRPRWTRRWRIQSARRVIHTLFDTGTMSPGQQLSYLRKVDPLVFEEAVLLALAARRIPVQPNARYSGDGGIDGRCRFADRTVYLQMKRYKGHINPRHVQAFRSLCLSAGVQGWFIHTGKTGLTSKLHCGREIRIVSGQRLLALLDPRAPGSFL